MSRFAPALALCFGLAACQGAPELEERWRDPEVKRYEPHRVLALAFSGEESFRRLAEDELVRSLAPQDALPSYTLLGSLSLDDPAAIRTQAWEAGLDAVLVLRVVEVEPAQASAPSALQPSTHVRFSDSSTYPTTWGTIVDHGTLRADRTYRVELSLFTLKDDKLVWSGVGRSMNPRSSRELVATVAEAALVRLREDGFLR